MTYGRESDGSYVFRLTKEENEKLINGVTLVKWTGDTESQIRIELSLERFHYPD